jgi:hypothetical protein
VSRSSARPKPSTAPAKEESKGGISPILWILLIIVVAVAAYFLGQAKG